MHIHHPPNILSVLAGPSTSDMFHSEILFLIIRFCWRSISVYGCFTVLYVKKYGRVSERPGTQLNVSIGRSDWPWQLQFSVLLDSYTVWERSTNSLWQLKNAKNSEEILNDRLSLERSYSTIPRQWTANHFSLRDLPTQANELTWRQEFATQHSSKKHSSLAQLQIPKAPKATFWQLLLLDICRSVLRSMLLLCHVLYYLHRPSFSHNLH